ncbi:MAG: AraC family transcriptional regulator ligand-binding domain-containing protein [Polyangiales bacterium]
MPVSVIFIRELVAALEANGRPADALLLQLELDRTALADLRTRVGEQQLEAAVEAVSSQLNDDALGLSIGERAPDHRLALLSSLLLSCSSLRVALETLSTYAMLIGDELELELDEREDTASLSFQLSKPLTPGQRFVADYSIAMVVRLIRRFVGNLPTVFRAVTLQHEAPLRNPVHALFGWLQLDYGRERNAIVFARAALDVQQAYADERAHLEYRDAADAILAEVRRLASVADRVRTVLRSREMLSKPSMKHVSSVIGLQPRTLARSLNAEGHSFRLLVDEARCMESCEALRHRIPIAEIAENVGFSEPSAFHRAFRRWTGQTPAQYARTATRPPA